MSAKTHSFVALYVGESISTALLISASANTDLVQVVAEYLLHDEQQDADTDESVKVIRNGRRKALSLILDSHRVRGVEKPQAEQGPQAGIDQAER